MPPLMRCSEPRPNSAACALPPPPHICSHPPMSDPQQPVYDPAKGKAFFTELQPRYQAMPADALPVVNADAGLAAIAALGVAARAADPALLPRFQSLPASEFDSANVELLHKAAWACWYAYHESRKERALASEARLPAELV